MHADAYFAIGAGHQVCQDYARVGASVREGGEEPAPFAIVADGCSSSPDADFGARFLAAAAARALSDPAGGIDPERTVRDAACAADATVGRDCLDATLLAAQVLPGGGVRVAAWGDGVVVARGRGGTLAAWEIAFPSGAPAYPSYLLDRGRLARYLSEGHGGRTVTVREGGALVGECRSTAGVDERGRPRGFAWGIDFAPGEVDLVLLATDGVHSFRRDGCPVPEALPAWEVIVQLTDFRTLAGAFVSRRCRSFLTRFCPPCGWRHHDDLAVAGLCLP